MKALRPDSYAGSSKLPALYAIGPRNVNTIVAPGCGCPRMHAKKPKDYVCVSSVDLLHTMRSALQSPTPIPKAQPPNSQRARKAAYARGAAAAAHLVPLR